MDKKTRLKQKKQYLQEMKQEIEQASENMDTLKRDVLSQNLTDKTNK